MAPMTITKPQLRELILDFYSTNDPQRLRIGVDINGMVDWTLANGIEQLNQMLIQTYGKGIDLNKRLGTSLDQFKRASTALVDMSLVEGEENKRNEIYIKLYKFYEKNDRSKLQGIEKIVDYAMYQGVDALNRKLYMKYHEDLGNEWAFQNVPTSGRFSRYNVAASRQLQNIRSQAQERPQSKFQAMPIPGQEAEPEHVEYDNNNQYDEGDQGYDHQRNSYYDQDNHQMQQNYSNYDDSRPPPVPAKRNIPAVESMRNENESSQRPPSLAPPTPEEAAMDMVEDNADEESEDEFLPPPPPIEDYLDANKINQQLREFYEAYDPTKIDVVEAIADWALRIGKIEFNKKLLQLYGATLDDPLPDKNAKKKEDLAVLTFNTSAMSVRQGDDQVSQYEDNKPETPSPQAYVPREANPPRMNKPPPPPGQPPMNGQGFLGDRVSYASQAQSVRSIQSQQKVPPSPYAKVPNSPGPAFQRQNSNFSREPPMQQNFVEQPMNPVTSPKISKLRREQSKFSQVSVQPGAPPQESFNAQLARVSKQKRPKPPNPPPQLAQNQQVQSPKVTTPKSPVQKMANPGPRAPVNSVNKVACDNYRLDMTGNSYGDCVCGMPRAAHRVKNNNAVRQRVFSDLENDSTFKPPMPMQQPPRTLRPKQLAPPMNQNGQNGFGYNQPNPNNSQYQNQFQQNGYNQGYDANQYQGDYGNDEGYDYSNNQYNQSGGYGYEQQGSQMQMPAGGRFGTQRPGNGQGFHLPQLQSPPPDYGQTQVKANPTAGPKVVNSKANGGQACDRYQLDMTGATFGVCVCGFPRADHSRK